MKEGKEKGVKESIKPQNIKKDERKEIRNYQRWKRKVRGEKRRNKKKIRLGNTKQNKVRRKHHN